MTKYMTVNTTWKTDMHPLLPNGAIRPPVMVFEGTTLLVEAYDVDFLGAARIRYGHCPADSRNVWVETDDAVRVRTDFYDLDKWEVYE